MNPQPKEKDSIKINISEARRQAEQELEQANKTVEPKSIVDREMTINIHYVDPDGISHDDVLVSRVMNGHDKTVCDITSAKMAGGRPLDSLPPVSQMRYLALARLGVQLRPCPEWLEKWAAEDDTLLHKVFDQLEAHNLRYFRRDLGTGTPEEIGSWLRIDSEILSESDSAE